MTVSSKIIIQIFFLPIYTLYIFANLIFRKLIPPPKKSLNGESFLITGAASGIGRAVALYLAKHHSKTKVILWDHNAVGNQETAKLAKSFGASVFHYTVDVSNRTDVAKTAKQVAEEVGDVTILFNNAGIVKLGDMFAVPPEDVEKIIQVNLISHFWTLNEFLPNMLLRNHGHVVTTCSGAGWVGLRYGPSYAASKYAIRGYIESLQSELRHRQNNKSTNVQFTTVYPWVVNTPIIGDSQIKFRFPYLFPMLEVQYVAENIINAICENQEALFLPKFHELLWRVKNIIPHRIHEVIEDLILEYVEINGHEKKLAANYSHF